ncbi:MAG: extracellular solute-binding protein [Burkholderiaceae bacterium]
MHSGQHRRTPPQFILAASSAIAFVAAAALPSAASAVTEVRVWHSMTGVPATTFTAIVDSFNAGQKNYHVDLLFKGDDRTTTTAGIAAMSLPNGPDLLQVSDVESGDVLAVRNGIKPMFEILPLAKSKDFEFFIPGAVAFMKDDRNRVRAFPLEASVPVLLYNESAYEKAGIPLDAPPATWRALQNQLVQLQDAGKGMKCSYTSSDQAWIHIENLGAVHGETIATRNNGLDGPGATLTFNDLLHVRHVALMISWVKSQLFWPSGHGEEGDARFASGECGTLTTASGSLGDIAKTARFKIGVAPLPYYEEGARQPSSALVGGSALWAMEGRTKDVYNGIATFLAYLATPVVAADWHQKTGSLPWTSAAYLVSERTGFYDRYPGLAGVMKSAALSQAATSRGIRLPNYEKVRNIMDMQLDAVWSGEKPAKLGLDDAVRLGDVAMKQVVVAPVQPPTKTSKVKAAIRKLLKKT